jgi:hypothetical protein
MRITKFRIGFVLGYVVATIRHSKDADPLVQRLKSIEATVRGARSWWNDLGDDHPVRRLMDSGRYAA